MPRLGETRQPAVFWTNQEAVHQAKYDPYRDLATAVQEVTGVVSPVKEFWVVSKDASEVSGHQIPERKWAIVRLRGKDNPEVAGHEIAHQVLGGRFGGGQVEEILVEGVGDLAVLEAIAQIEGTDAAAEITERAERYAAIELSPEQRRQVKESADLFARPAEVTDESLGHLVGRKFAYALYVNRTDVTLPHLVAGLSQYPPRREQLLEPERYLDFLKTQEVAVEPIEPVQTSFRDPPERII